MINKKWDYKKCNDIKKVLTKMNLNEDDIDFIITQIKNRDKHIEALCKHNEIKKRTCVSISERKLNVEYTNSQSTKLTINPCDGRVSLKISNKIKSSSILSDFISIAKSIMSYEFEPTTHRGKITFNVKDSYYHIYLSSDSKRFNKNFIVKKDENNVLQIQEKI